MSTEQLQSKPFVSPSLEKLYRGDISVGVPILNDSVQIGTYAPGCEKGRLQVHKTLLRGNVEVQLTDGRPLQVTSNISGSQLFEEPVEELCFLRTRRAGGQIMWIASGTGLKIQSHALLTDFAARVGMYARVKQQNQYWRARL